MFVLLMMAGLVIKLHKKFAVSQLKYSNILHFSASRNFKKIL